MSWNPLFNQCDCFLIDCFVIYYPVKYSKSCKLSIFHHHLVLRPLSSPIKKCEVLFKIISIYSWECEDLIWILIICMCVCMIRVTWALCHFTDNKIMNLNVLSVSKSTWNIVTWLEIINTEAIWVAVSYFNEPNKNNISTSMYPKQSSHWLDA